MKIKKHVLLFPLVAFTIVGCTSATRENSNNDSGDSDVSNVDPEVTKYSVTVVEGEGFEVSGLEDSYESGATVSFTVTVTDPDKRIKEVTCNGTVLASNDQGSYSFVMPETSVVISVALTNKVTLPTSDDWLENFADHTTMSYKLHFEFKLNYEEVIVDGDSYYTIDDPNYSYEYYEYDYIVGSNALFYSDTLYFVDDSGSLLRYMYNYSEEKRELYRNYGNELNLGDVPFTLYQFVLNKNNGYTLFEQTDEEGVYTLTNKAIELIFILVGHSEIYYQGFDVGRLEGIPTITLTEDNSALIYGDITSSAIIGTNLIVIDGSYLEVEITDVGTTNLDVDAILAS